VDGGGARVVGGAYHNVYDEINVDLDKGAGAAVARTPEDAAKLEFMRGLLDGAEEFSSTLIDDIVASCKGSMQEYVDMVLLLVGGGSGASDEADAEAEENFEPLGVQDPNPTTSAHPNPNPTTQDEERRREGLEVLAQAFPRMGREELSNALAVQDGDVDATVAMLLFDDDEDDQGGPEAGKEAKLQGHEEEMDGLAVLAVNKAEATHRARPQRLRNQAKYLNNRPAGGRDWAPVAPNTSWTHAQPRPEQIRMSPEARNAANQAVYSEHRGKLQSSQNEAKRQRNHLMKMYADAFQRKDYDSMKLIQEQRKTLDEDIRRIQDETGEKIFSEINRHTNESTFNVDLHGMHVNEAIAKVKSVFESFRNLNTGPVKITLITGRGSHSEGGRSKLIPALQDCLTSMGRPCTQNTGTLVTKYEPIRPS